ncbi:cyclase family protein [Adhaeribacter radiodurans]|uniref:Cyclase family protein n=1 Tax=Adhaeribacter radiodurans TaxID=2745197 RepID=A0A7L7LC55_9BACT|nr:cyclase family protein [Adhaeribacter radiodurans]QMU29959.1 cyclase family protein [Adhaeribacter radiodurans]
MKQNQTRTLRARLLQKNLILIFLSFLGVGCREQSGFPAGEWIDLSYDLSNQTITWPTSDAFQLDTVSAGITEQGYYYSAYNFCASEHGGTHIDAPIHFAQGRKTVDQLSLTQLTGPAVKIDVSRQTAQSRDYQVQIADILNWEKENGRIPDGSMVLLQTGFGQYWPDALKYLGTDKRGPEGVQNLHFPGLAPEAATWLVQNRKIKAVGIDTASIDYGQSQLYGSHVTLMQQDIPAFENVANLEKVPVTGAQIIALPIKIKGGSGGPLRIIAFIPKTTR